MAEEFEAIAELSAAAAAELAAAAVANRGGKALECNNCGTPLIGPYCAACGQPHETYRKSLWRLLWGTIEHIINFDSRLMQTMRALMLEPGELPRAFKEGQTQRYVPAPRLYLFVSLFFFLFLSLSGIALMQLEVNVADNVNISVPSKGVGLEIGSKKTAPNLLQIDPKDLQGIEDKARTGKLSDADLALLKKAPPGVSTRAHFFERLGSVRSHISNSAKAQLKLLEADAEKQSTGPLSRWFATHVVKAFEDIALNPAALNGPLTAWIPRVLFLLLPLFALLLWLFYWRQRKKFLLIDHLVFSLTLHTFAFVILIFAALAVQVAPADVVGWAALIIIAAYFFFSIKWFYGQNYFWTSLKFLVIAFIYASFFLGPALAGVIFASMVQA